MRSVWLYATPATLPRTGLIFGILAAQGVFRLTIVTEFIGLSLALRYSGVSPYISVPLTAVLLIAITASGSFARWERAIFLFIATSLVLYPLALAEPQCSVST